MVLWSFSTCKCRDRGLVKFLWQCLQEKALSIPEWTWLTWVCKLMSWEKRRPHWLHIKSFLFSWTALICNLRPCVPTMALAQWGHGIFMFFLLWPAETIVGYFPSKVHWLFYIYIFKWFNFLVFQRGLNISYIRISQLKKELFTQ